MISSETAAERLAASGPNGLLRARGGRGLASAGGYRVADYARAGLPLNLLVGVVALGAVYLVWL